MTTECGLMTTQEAARYLAIHVVTLSQWRSRGDPMIPFVRTGRHVKYLKKDLDRFIAQNTVRKV